MTHSKARSRDRAKRMFALFFGTIFFGGIVGGVVMMILGHVIQDDLLVVDGIIVFSVLAGMLITDLIIKLCVWISHFCYCGAYGHEIEEIDERRAELWQTLTCRKAGKDRTKRSSIVSDTDVV